MNTNSAIIELDKNTGSLISYFSNLVKKYGGINLAQGVPDFDPPEELLNLLSELSHSKTHQYAPSYGNKKLLNFLNNEYLTFSNNADVLITNGATEAISLIYTYLSSLYTKDFNVATFSPAYESYIHLPKIFKHNLFSYSINDDNYFDEKEFKDFFEKNKIKLLFLASPGNPYGKVVPKEKMIFLLNLAKENNSYILLDAVYKDFYFDDQKPFYPLDDFSENLFYVNSFSKKISITGWRLGYLLMHRSHFSQLSYMHDYIGLSASSYLQHVVSEFVELPAYLDYTNNLRQVLRENYIISSARLKTANFLCPDVDGGYFIWCKLPENYAGNGLEFAKDLYLSEKIAVVPGVHFGQEWDRHIRINLAQQSSVLEDGISSIIRFVENKEKTV